VKKENRHGPSKIRLDDPKIKKLLDIDNHANNYRDGEWGSIRHFVVKEGWYLCFPLPTLLQF